MRTKLTIKNITATLLLEIVVAVSGIIIPRYFIMAYGSSINGLVSSISQFITYMGLVEAGVSSAGVVELYKPLTNNEEGYINGILTSIKGFYYKSGIIFLALDAILIAAYPFVVSNEIGDVTFIRLMIIVLSLNGIIDYFILGKYRVLLMANQRNYIIAFFQIIGMVFILVFSIILINANVNAIIVKSVVPIVYLLRTIAVIIYCKKRYKYLSFNAPRIESAFGQKSSAFFHQIVGMVCNNTDMVLLTLMLQKGALVEVSVYSVYNFVNTALGNFFYAISLGIRSSFGQVIAREENTTLEYSYNIFEYIYFILLFVVYTCMGTMLYSFISLYSASFSDSYMYTRWILVFIFTLCGLLQNLRIPGMTVQIAAGHFKETQVAAAIEVILNLGISIVLIHRHGIVGVLIGTCAAYAFRTTYILIYHDYHFLNGTLRNTLFRIIRSFVFSYIIVFVFIRYFNPVISSWTHWVLMSAFMFIFSSIILLIVNGVFEKEMLKQSLGFIKKTVMRK